MQQLVEQIKTAHVQPPMPSSTQVKPPMASSAQVQQPMPATYPALTRFHETRYRIIAEPPPERNGPMEQDMQQQGDPPTTDIRRRKPIIDIDYDMGKIDKEVALFIKRSWDSANVVDIDGHVLTAQQLRPNVTGGFIQDAVISFQISILSTYMHTPTMS